MYPNLIALFMKVEHNNLITHFEKFYPKKNSPNKVIRFYAVSVDFVLR
jgi:hypothetical protein